MTSVRHQQGNNEEQRPSENETMGIGGDDLPKTARLDSAHACRLRLTKSIPNNLAHALSKAGRKLDGESLATYLISGAASVGVVGLKAPNSSEAPMDCGLFLPLGSLIINGL